MSWQVHLIENRYCSLEKTLIVCETNSRFTYFIPLNRMIFTPHWIKNTDLSVNGHIADAAQWVTQTLQDRNLERLSQPPAFEISNYINSQTKSIKVNNKKQRFIPIERLLEYIQQIIGTNPPSSDKSNVVPFSRQ